MGMLVWI